MSDRVDLKDFVAGFVAEAEELVGSANGALLEIDSANATGSVRPKAVKDLFRVLHTIKGLAGMVGVQPIVDIAHALENLVRAADRSGGRLRHGAVEVALTAVRAIAERVRALGDQQAVAPAPEELLDRIAAIDIGAESVTAAPAIAPEWDPRLTDGERHQVAAALGRGVHAYSMTFSPSAERAERGLTIATVRERIAELGEIVKVAPRSVGRAVVFDLLVVSDAAATAFVDAAETTDVRELVRPEPALVELAGLDDDTAPSASLGRSVVRVELARLDDLQEQLSLLIVSRFRLEKEITELRARGVDVRRLREIAAAQARQLRDLRRAILRARLLRLSEVLEPLPLLVRSLARPGQREVKLELDARDAELDKAVADRLLPAIVHLVRNAVDHAIEPPDEREKAGKPRTGTVAVRCVESTGNQLALTISDDGRGIDRDAVAARAGHAIGDAGALLATIMTPGFSTRDVVTYTSGRGVGMDIVRKIVVEQLGGQVTLDSELGAGTTFTLRIPVTIAIIDVFSFACGAQTFAVPVSSVEEIFELETAQRERLVERVSLLERRGKAVPLMSLGTLLAIDAGAQPAKAFLVRRGTSPIAFAVDRVLGRQEVVVRPIDDPLARVPGIAGAADLGDGRPTLVLDLVELGARLPQREGPS